MAIYEYECEACSNRFEKRAGYEEALTAVCPKCEGKGKRIFSPAAVRFGGGNYYSTGGGGIADSCGTPRRGFG